MSTKTWIRHTVWIAFLGMVVLTTAEVEAQRRGGGRGFGGGGGGFSRSGAASSGSLGRNFSSRAGGYSRNGAASSGNWQGSAASQISRQNTAKGMQTRRQAGEAANREDRQAHANAAREDRQSYRTEAREDWQEYGEPRREYWENGGSYYYGGYPAYPAGGIVAGMMIGSTLTAAAFNAQKSSCTTLSVNSTTYYHCGSTWYQPFYRSGSVSYIVVNPPK